MASCLLPSQRVSIEGALPRMPDVEAGGILLYVSLSLYFSRNRAHRQLIIVELYNSEIKL
jgi:hypothetical protein